MRTTSQLYKEYLLGLVTARALCEGKRKKKGKKGGEKKRTNNTAPVPGASEWLDACPRLTMQQNKKRKVRPMLIVALFFEQKKIDTDMGLFLLCLSLLLSLSCGGLGPTCQFAVCAPTSPVTACDPVMFPCCETGMECKNNVCVGTSVAPTTTFPQPFGQNDIFTVKSRLAQNNFNIFVSSLFPSGYEPEVTVPARFPFTTRRDGLLFCCFVFTRPPARPSRLVFFSKTPFKWERNHALPLVSTTLPIRHYVIVCVFPAIVLCFIGHFKWRSSSLSPIYFRASVLVLAQLLLSLG